MGGKGRKLLKCICWKIVWVLAIVALSSLPVLGDGAGHGHAGHGEAVQSQAGGISSPIMWVVFFLALVSLGVVVWVFSRMSGVDLLRFSVIRNVVKSPWYPAVFEVPTLIFFGFVVYYFFFGPIVYSKNPGSVLAWTLWWPLVPLTFVLFGRAWCAICPFPVISDFIQGFVHPVRKAGLFLMTYGIWIMDGIFIAITLFDRVYGMVDHPWLSGLVFLFILSGVVIIALRYERRTFCRHVCFLGGVSGNYSMLSGLSVEPKDRGVCASCRIKACYFGSGKVAGCPYSNVLPAKEGMRNCTLCANCIKSCPYDNVAIRIRSIASELWSHSRVTFEESFFAKLMVGIVIVQNLGMLPLWGRLVDWFSIRGFSEGQAIAVMYFSSIALPLVLISISSFISDRFQTVPVSPWKNFAAFGYAFIPIDVAGHIAHNLFHLLEEGMAIAGAFWGLLDGTVLLEGSVASMTVIKGLQFALIAAGGAGTLYVAYRISREREETPQAAFRIFAPHALLLLAIVGVNVFLFVTPMAHRGG